MTRENDGQSHPREYICCPFCLDCGGGFMFGVYFPVCPHCHGIGMLEVEVKYGIV